MPLLRPPASYSGAKEVSRADVLDAPAERIIAQGRLFCRAVTDSSAGQSGPGHNRQRGCHGRPRRLRYFCRRPDGRTRVAIPRAGRRLSGTRLRRRVSLVLGALWGGRATPVSASFAFFVLLAASLRWNWQAVGPLREPLLLRSGGSGDAELRTRAALIRGVYVPIMGVTLAHRVRSVNGGASS